MKNTLLKLDEVAELEGITYEALKKRVQRNELEAVKIETKGRRGFEYRVELDHLSAKAKRKYMAENKLSLPDLQISVKENKYDNMTIEDLTDKQRAQIALWIKIIEAWQNYTSDAWKEKDLKTEEFVKVWNATNDFKISSRTLKRKRKLYKDYGEVALSDGRKQSGRKGKSSIPDIAWNVFQLWYLDEAQPCVSTVYKALEAWLSMDMPELLPLPSEITFYRKVKTLDYSLIKYFREGNKAFEDACMPYIVRTYEDIDSNDIWSSDYHTLDAFVKDDVTGEIFRPHLAVWIDVRSRKILSVVLAKNSNSTGVVLSFRKAAEKYGLPDKVYLDNGREFLVSDFGGRGKRKTNDNADYGSTILERCGVTMYNAIVKNAKTKIIERIFRNVHNDFSKLVDTYCGGRPSERPERLTGMLKNEKNVPLLSEVTKQLEAYIEGWYNETPSKARGMNNKCPNQVYADNLIKKRTATSEQLNLMLLRSERLQEVKRNGVLLKFGETQLWYYSQELIESYEKKKVFVRYNPEDLKKVRVYNSDERFICEAELTLDGGYALGEDADIEAIKQLNKRKKAKRAATLAKVAEMAESAEREFGGEIPDMLDVVVRKAEENIEQAKREYSAGIIYPAEFNVEKEAKATATGETVVVDINKMAENAAKKR